ncbi:MAG: ligase-associated DNA damage response endonuclease PdeM [Terricaulis sp.]
MPMLARPFVAKPAPRRARPAAPPVALVGKNAEMRINGTLVAALPEGALWIEAARTLVVSDLHLEKGSSFARGGQMLPPYDTRACLRKLVALIEALAPDRVVSLGDSFHDVGGPMRMDASDRAVLEALTARCDWVWILGNHDPEIPSALGGTMLRELRIESLLLRHEPYEGDAPGEIAGHLHPCARVLGRGRSVRRRCFAADGHRTVMPAFGAYTGGLNLCDNAFSKIFPNGALALMLARDRVLPAAYARLSPDGG